MEEWCWISRRFTTIAQIRSVFPTTWELRYDWTVRWAGLWCVFVLLCFRGDVCAGRSRQPGCNQHLLLLNPDLPSARWQIVVTSSSGPAAKPWELHASAPDHHLYLQQFLCDQWNYLSKCSMFSVNLWVRLLLYRYELFGKTLWFYELDERDNHIWASFLP